MITGDFSFSESSLLRVTKTVYSIEPTALNQAHVFLFCRKLTHIENLILKNK